MDESKNIASHVPAQPGFLLVVPVINGGVCVDLWRQPIIVWLVETWFHPDPIGTQSWVTPLTISGVVDDGPSAIQAPDGTMEIPGDREILNDTDCIEYFNEQLSAASQHRAKCREL